METLLALVSFCLCYKLLLSPLVPCKALSERNVFPGACLNGATFIHPCLSTKGERFRKVTQQRLSDSAESPLLIKKEWSLCAGLAENNCGCMSRGRTTRMMTMLRITGNKRRYQHCGERKNPTPGKDKQLEIVMTTLKSSHEGLLPAKSFGRNLLQSRPVTCIIQLY